MRRAAPKAASEGDHVTTGGPAAAGASSGAPASRGANKGGHAATEAKTTNTMPARPELASAAWT